MNARKSNTRPTPNDFKGPLHDEKRQPDDLPNELEEDSLDRTLEESFPASDPPSSIPDPDENAA